jgi:hypothetical protein
VKSKAGFFADSRKRAVGGGRQRSGVVAVKPAESLLLGAMQRESKEIATPSKEKNLPESVLKDFARLIRGAGSAGACGTRTREEACFVARAGRAFWSMRPPSRPAVSAVGDAAWAIADVDRFVPAARKPEGLKPAAEAPAAAVLRRYLYVTGLPPAAKAVAFFRMEDPEAEVDRIFRGDAFGVRQRRQRLDVARHAENNGKNRNAIFHQPDAIATPCLMPLPPTCPFDVFLRGPVAGDLPAGAQPERQDAVAGGDRISRTRFQGLRGDRTGGVPAKAIVWLGHRRVRSDPAQSCGPHARTNLSLPYWRFSSSRHCSDCRSPPLVRCSDRESFPRPLNASP